MTEHLIEAITTWSGPSGGPWRTRTMFATDGSGESGRAVTAKLSQFWSRLTDWIGQGQVWSLPLAWPVIETATGRLVDVISSPGGTGSPGNFKNTNPTQAQVCTRLGTGRVVAGRGLQGRLYVPGVTSVPYDTDAPFISPDRQAELAGWVVSDLCSAPVLSPVTVLSVWSRTHGVAYPVQGATTDAYLTTLRSRRS